MASFPYRQTTLRTRPQAAPHQLPRTHSLRGSHHTVKPIESLPPDSSRRGLDGTVTSRYA
jgi:hypothetical protein